MPFASWAARKETGGASDRGRVDSDVDGAVRSTWPGRCCDVLREDGAAGSSPLVSHLPPPPPPQMALRRTAHRVGRAARSLLSATAAAPVPPAPRPLGSAASPTGTPRLPGTTSRVTRMNGTLAELVANQAFLRQLVLHNSKRLDSAIDGGSFAIMSRGAFPSIMPFSSLATNAGVWLAAWLAFFGVLTYAASLKSEVTVLRQDVAHLVVVVDRLDSRGAGCSLTNYSALEAALLSALPNSCLAIFLRHAPT